MITDKHLTILASVAGAMIILTILFYSECGGAASGFKAGMTFIQGLDPENIGAIVITRGEETITLSREEGGDFVIKEKSNYPASVKKINDFLLDILKIRYAELVTDSPENHAELGVAEDSPEAVKIVLEDTEGDELFVFFKGKKSDRTPGSYVRIEGENTVYTTEKFLRINTKPNDFLETSLLSVEKKDVQVVFVRTPASSYTITRDGDEGILLRDIPAGKQPKGNKYKVVFRSLSGVTMNDVVPADSLDVSWDRRYVCRLDSGLIYVIDLAQKEDEYYAKLSAQGPSARALEASKYIFEHESEESLKKKANVREANDQAREFSAKHTGWAYVINKVKFDNLSTPLEDLLEEEGKEKKGKKEKEGEN